MRSRTVFRLMAIAVTGVVVSGCQTAQELTAFRTFTTLGGTSVAVDAKQRFLVTSRRPVSDANGNVRGAGSYDIICAEPSPDALSALAASASSNVDFSRSGTAAALAFERAISEASGSIGLRTQTITILRDGMYRMCEAYATGALDQDTMARLMRRYQSVMLGLLAIEQLTGAVKASPLALSGRASTSPVKGLEAAIASVEARTQALDAAKKKSESAASDQADAKGVRSEAEKAVAEAKKDVAARTSGADAKLAQAQKDLDASIAEEKKADAAYAAAKEAQTDRQKELEAAQATRAAVLRRSNVAASTDAQVYDGDDDGPTTAISEKTAKHIARATRKIVEQVTTGSFAHEACLELITKEPPATNDPYLRDVRRDQSETCLLLLMKKADIEAARQALSDATDDAADLETPQPGEGRARSGRSAGSPPPQTSPTVQATDRLYQRQTDRINKRPPPSAVVVPVPGIGGGGPATPSTTPDTTPGAPGTRPPGQ